jgi:hypothetical protein
VSGTIIDWLARRSPDGARWDEIMGDLSEPTKTWLDRIWHATIDADVSEADALQVTNWFYIYVRRLPEPEGKVASASCMALIELLSDIWDVLPRCDDCECVLCPHCLQARHEHS